MAGELAPDELGYLRRALELAARGRFGTSPNPRVGAVLVGGDGRVIGEGYHQRVGGPHAEIEALRDAASSPAEIAGSTLYVSLEPCDHHGRTPPCSQAVIDAGVRRVVACHRDPDARVDGGGFARLRAAGVEVRHGFLVDPAVRLNWRFLSSRVLGRPAVTVKWAMSLDGRIATVDRDSQWISSQEGRRWALELREQHDAILVGSGTVLADDPRLDRRLGLCDGAITRVVLDRRLRTPPGARLLTRGGPLLIYVHPVGDAGKRRRLRESADTSGGADLEIVERDDVSPSAVLRDLHRRGVTSVLVEGGGEVAAAFIEADLFDQIAVCCAPLLIAGREAPGPLGGSGFSPLAGAPRLAAFESGRRGPDFILKAFRKACLPALSASVGGS